VENQSLTLGSAFLVQATAKPGVKPEELEKAINDELAALRETGPTPAELERARNRIETKLIGDLERLGGFGGVADRLNYYNHYLADPGYLQKDLQRYESATPASVKALAAESIAEEKIEGDRAWRFQGGYSSLLEVLHSVLNRANCDLRLSTAVHTVFWQHHLVRADTSRGPVTASRAVITLPLGVLQQHDGPGEVVFEPSLKPKQSALGLLPMGAVIRVTIMFRDRFWERIHATRGNETLDRLSFLFSQSQTMPTWWTQYPQRAPVLTGWVAGPAALELSRRSEESIFQQAVETLRTLTGISRDAIHHDVESWYIHNWQTEAYALGGYSYVNAEGTGAQQKLAEPIDDTLFFAGEATESEGHHATVHGAIATGHRAAKEVLGK
jgi:monoamine oxidase